MATLANPSIYILIYNPFQNFSRVHCTQVSESGPLGLLLLYYRVFKQEKIPVFVRRQIGSAAAIGLYMSHQFVRFITFYFLSYTEIQYKETNYIAYNIDNNK